MTDTGDFYLMLELDPSVDDWAVLAERIVEKQRKWSQDRNQGNPKARRRAERCLDLLPRIEATLKDPVLRKEAAALAKKQLADRQKTLLRELDDAVSILRSGGSTCNESQLRRLVKRFGATFSEDEIKKRLRSAGVEVESGEPAKKRRRAPRAQIDQVTAGQIRRNLEHLGLSDLYSFLGLPRQSSPRALGERADEIYKENQRLGKTDPDSSAANELAGVAKKVFADDREKAKYDAYLAVAAMEDLKDTIELAGSDGFLTSQEMDNLIRQARQRGVSVEDARDYVEAHAAKRKWGVQSDADLPSEALKLCGFCSSLAPEAAVKCPNCGRSLELECPRCSVRNPTSDAACSSCGCRTGDAPLVQGLLREGERLMIEGAFREAREAIEKALHYWPGWGPAEKAAKRLEGRLRARESEFEQVEKLVRESRLMAARSALERFERAHGSRGLEAVRRQVELGLAKAESSYRTAVERRREGAHEKALELCEEALAACADFEPARKAMAGSPPPAPVRLEVRPSGEGFRVSWQPPDQARRLTFRVLRKAGGAPTGAEDGDPVAELPRTSVDDAAVAPGVAWYYAVWTVRSGVFSAAAAESGPHLRTAEVTDLEAVAGDRQVTLHWTCPPGRRRVEVWRKAGAVPRRRGDGEPLTVSGDGVHDVGLGNGETYGYLVVAVFADPSRPGEELATPGVGVTVTPVAPPPAVEDLRCDRKGKSVLLSWTPIHGARVEIRQAAELPDYQPGLVVAVSQAGRFGRPVPTASTHSAQVTLGTQGRTCFVPLSVAAGTAVVGRAVEVTALDPVTRLSAHRAGRGIGLSWEWPAGIAEVLVRWAYDGYPDDPRAGHGSLARVTREQYRQAGSWLLPEAERRRHYFTVFAKAGELYAEGARAVESLGQEIAVTYHVVVKKSLLRRAVEEAWVELSCSDGNCSTLPAVVVVGKQRSVPLSPHDGQVFTEVPSVRFEKGRATIPVPRQHWRGHPYLKLFFADSAAAREVRLLPAAKERLVLG